MTERKPPGVTFETWIDRQVRTAAERGEFDDLPGAGQPLPGLDKPRDELWWVRDYVRRAGLSSEALLPLPLQLRKETERLWDTVGELLSEQAVRDSAEALNRRVVEWLRAPSGPRVPIAPVAVDDLVEHWRTTRPPGSGNSRAGETSRQAAPAAAGRRRLRWWQRLRPIRRWR